MDKNIYLGVGSDGNECCVLKTAFSFASLGRDSAAIEPDDFVHSATNWGGCDTISRTLSLRGLSLTGRKIKLPRPITYYGMDHDCGREYSWRFDVSEIWETKVS